MKNNTIEKKKEIRRLELELEQLPTENELRQYAMKKREQQQELDDLNDMIKKLEAKSAKDDDEETLFQKIREAQQLDAELMESPEQPKPAEQPTNPDPFKSKSEKV